MANFVLSAPRRTGLARASRPVFVAAAALSAAGCSLAFDFDEIEGLPCDEADQCLEDFICRLDNRTCIPRGSVDPGRSCGIQVEGDPDNLCPQDFACVNVAGRGLRCLRTCQPVVPVGEDANLRLFDECEEEGRFCWELPTGGGACDEGECREVGNQGCPVGSTCVELNGAGKCFAECNIFADPPDCVGGVCQPIDQASSNACVAPGDRSEGETCNSLERCAPETEGGFPLICARAEGESSGQVRCAVRCDPFTNSGCPNGEPCLRIAGSPASGASVEVGICSR
jgi:hypothetical protein